MKKFIVLLLSILFTMSIMGCSAVSIDGSSPASSDSANSQNTDGDKNGSIGLSISTMNNPFFVTLSEGADAKAKELGMNLITVDAGDDSAKQASDIEDLVSKGIKVLIVNPVDSDAVAPAVETAISKGIKVVSVDRVVNGVEVDCAIASDNIAGAKLAAEYLVELAGEDAKCVELEGVNGASATIDRGEGFHQVADDKLNVAASQTANFNRAEGMSVMENLLQAHPDVQCVFAHNDEMALGAVEAVGGKDIIIAGFDATDDAINSIKEGRMAATVAQKPDLMGATAVETAQKLMAGESVEKVIAVEVKLITKDNVNE